MKYSVILAVIAAGFGLGLNACLEIRPVPAVHRPAVPAELPPQHRDRMVKEIPRAGADRIDAEAALRTPAVTPSAAHPTRPDHRIFSRAGVEWRHEREEVRP